MHAVSLAEAGADVVNCDCVRTAPVSQPLGTKDKFDETSRIVESTVRLSPLWS